MKVNEIFYSLAGEGIRTGQATIFIRLAGCNLKCWFCVYGNTYINTPSGMRKIRDIDVGGEVISYDGVKLSTSKVIRKSSRTVPVSGIYKIQFQNSKKKIFATGEHPLFISSKWRQVRDIEVNDEILSFSGGKINGYIKTINNPMWDEEVAKKSIANHPNMKGIPKHKGFAEKIRQARYRFNPISNPDVVEKGMRTRAKKRGILPSGCEKQIIEIAEEYNLPINWVGNHQLIIGYKSPDFKVKGQKKVIEVYDTTFKYSGKYRDEEWEKKRVLHFAKYGYKCFVLPVNGYIKIQEREKYAKKISRFIHNGIVVKSVGKLSTIREKVALDRGFRKSASDEIEVFNIECSPHHNYLIEGILSHNCDTEYESYTEMTEEEIAAEVNKYPAEWITLTGGEPTLQDCAKLIKLLKPRHKISIETNGTRYVPWLEKLDLVTVSPKNLFHPKAQVDERIWNLPVVEAKFVITRPEHLESVLQFDRNCILFLQPMNNDPHITMLCVETIKANPHWRLSLQMHKLINIP